MRCTRTMTAILVAVAVVMGTSSPASAKRRADGPVATMLASFGSGLGSGSTVGPDGALYVTDGNAGSVLRVDPKTGDVTTFASGLPPQVAGIGGAIDVAFIGHTAYVLVTLVGPFFGQNDVVGGIYRINRNGTSTVVADLGLWSKNNPPATDFFIDSGVQYALERFRGGFLVTDGHHNRVLRVTLDGDISPLRAFGNIAPTGLEISGNTVVMAEAGPVPHRPADAKVVAFTPRSSTVTEVASGQSQPAGSAGLTVDVELGGGHELYALLQGIWDLPNDPANAGAPASPNSGKLVKVDDGSFTTVVNGLDRPTSLEFIGNTAYVVTLTGTILRIDHASR
jgi:hypothetical protein